MQIAKMRSKIFNTDQVRDRPGKMELVPISYKAACEFVSRYHRHHKPPQGYKYAIATAIDNIVVGVVIVGRPVSRVLDDGCTLEVTRCCTDGTKNACSMLYATAWRAAKAMGYKKLITYILNTEPGTSLKASGWKCLGRAGGGSWNTPSRPRVDKSPQQFKIKFMIDEI